MLLLDVKTSFDAALDELLKGEDQALVKFVKHHERKPVVLANLCEQVIIYEKNIRRVSKGTLAVNKVDRDKMIFDVAKMFALGVLEVHRQQRLSVAEKSRIRNKDNLRNEMAKLLKEVP